MHTKEFQEHPIWRLIEQAEVALEHYDDEAKRSDAYIDAITKWEYLRWVLEQSDARLITSQDLDRVQSQVQEATNLTTQSTQSPRRLQSIEPLFQNIFSQFPYPRIKKIFRSEINDIIVRFHEETQGYLSKISEAQKEFEKSLHSTRSGVAEIEERLEKLRAETARNQAQAETLLEQWRSEMQTTVSDKLRELDRDAQSQRENNSKTFSAHESSIKEAIEDIASQREAMARATEESAMKTRQILDERLEQITTAAEATLEDIKKIYNVAGQTALAGDFDKAAKDETLVATIYSILAGLFFIAAPAIFLWQWSTIDAATIGSFGIVVKATTALAFLVPAAFFGNTAQRHRRVATALRSLGVRVATFDAYLVTLADEDRRQMKTKMAEVFFATNISPDRLRQSSTKEIEKAVELISATLDKAQEVVRSVKGT